MSKIKTVWLRLHDKAEKSYNKDGSLQSGSQLVKLPYSEMSLKDSKRKSRFHNYLSVMKNRGQLIEVERVVVPSEGGYKDVSDKELDQIKSEVAVLSQPDKAPKTPEEKRIEDLEAKIEKITSGKNQKQDKDNDQESNEKVLDDSSQYDEDLEGARKQYEELFGKKPHHAKKIESLREEIESELNN